MHFKAVLIPILLTVSCSHFDNRNDSFITQTNSQLAAKEADQNTPLKKILEKNRIQAIEKKKASLKKFTAEMSRNQRLSNLETAKISKNDLEVRFRKQSAWWKNWLLILKLKNEKWSAEYQEQIFYDGTVKLKSVSKSELGEPASGWGNLWEKLIDEELLTLPDGLENGGFDPCPDCEGLLIETNIGGNYRICHYTKPVLESELRETRQIAKISNIIAEEFGLSKFATKNSVE